MVILIWFLWSLLVAFLGRDRKLGFWGFFLASLFFSPLALTFVLILTQPTRSSARYR